LSVPVQLIAWKDSSPKWLNVCPSGKLNPTHSLSEHDRLGLPVNVWGSVKFFTRHMPFLMLNQHSTVWQVLAKSYVH